MDHRDHSGDHWRGFHHRRRLRQGQLHHEQAQDAALLRSMHTETRGHETHLQMGNLQSE